MNDVLNDIMDSSNFDEEITTTTKTGKPGYSQATHGNSFETYGSSLEDRFGQELWVKTRACFCPTSAPSDCRFHGQEEPGWEKCPYEDKAKGDSNVLGRWLFAKNPNYGKNPPKDTNGR